ncbi:hypothetical protein NPIL_179861 [Nephila pilipes]|uniref:Uncharacterized protein n=1 Tax=Nephila pilipes TaxID=299642 RepID=A0A8X6TD62_NEPPI|nr:hypothetical protein NPIL_179861 [Nephila pilipes]
MLILVALLRQFGWDIFTHNSPHRRQRKLGINEELADQRIDEGDASEDAVDNRKLFLHARSPIIDISQRFMEIHKRKIEKLKKSRRKMKKKVWFEE